MKGTVQADFAGSWTEAKEFAKANGFGVLTHSISPNDEGLPMLSLRYSGQAELNVMLDKFDSAGWDRDSVLIVRKTWTRRGVKSIVVA